MQQYTYFKCRISKIRNGNFPQALSMLFNIYTLRNNKWKCIKFNVLSIPLGE